MELRKELEDLINKSNAESSSNTPDYILSNYLQSCLDNFDACIRLRDSHYGFETKQTTETLPENP